MANGEVEGQNGSGTLALSSSPINLSSGGFLPLRTLQSFLISRYVLSGLSGFNSQFAGKRNLNLILGYDEVVGIESYRYEYERGGIAKRIVEIFPRATWANGFEVVEDANLKFKTKFEKSVTSTFRRLGVLGKLIRASILANIGHYSVILIGAPGDPATPLPRARSFDSNNIAYMMPLGEDKATIEEIVGQSPDDDPFDPRYGLPKYYQINLSQRRTRYGYLLGNQHTTASFSRRVHWSRVIHIVREPLDNEIYCSPILEGVWNLLHDLHKLTGGLSEAALRRGWPGLHANINKETKFEGGADSPEVKAIKTQLEDYNIGLGNGITTRGTDVNALSTTGQIQIKDNAEAILEQIATTIGAPMRWFRGAEVGQLASGQDKNNANDRIMELRASHNEPVVRELTNRLVDYGYLPQPRNPDYQVEFPVEEEMSEKEKAENAKLLKDSGVMSQDEIRDRIYGLKPLPKDVEDQGEEKTPDSEIVPDDDPEVPAP